MVDRTLVRLKQYPESGRLIFKFARGESARHDEFYQLDSAGRRLGAIYRYSTCIIGTRNKAYYFTLSRLVFFLILFFNNRYENNNILRRLWSNV